MRVSLPHALSRRERQILDILYQKERATVYEVLQALPDPPSYSSVRALLRIMEEKGYVRHESEGNHYVFLPTYPRHNAARQAIKQVVQTFFGGSIAGAVATFLSEQKADLSEEEWEQLERLIAEARREGR